jgi:hypothetical protein
MPDSGDKKADDSSSLKTYLTKDPHLRAELRTQLDWANLPKDPQKQLNAMHGYVTIIGNISRFRDGLSSIKNPLERRMLAEKYNQHTKDIICGYKELDPVILGEMCKSLGRYELIERDQKSSYKRTNYSLLGAGLTTSLAVFRATPGSPLMRTFIGIGIFLTATKILNDYANEVTREFLLNNPGAEEEIKDTLKKLIRVSRQLEVEAVLSEEPTAFNQEDEFTNYAQITRDPFSLPEAFERTGLKPTEISDEDLENLPPEIKDFLKRLAKTEKVESEEERQELIVTLLEDIKGAAIEQGQAQANVYKILREQEAEKAAVAKMIKESRIRESNIEGSIYLMSMFIERGLGDTKAANDFQKFSSRLYSAYKDQAAYDGKAIGAAAVTAGWVGVALVAYDMFNNAKSKDAYMGMMRQISEQIQRLHTSMLENFTVVQEQNIKTLELLTQGFNFADGKLDLNRVKLQEVSNQIKSLAKSNNTEERDELDIKFVNAFSDLEGAIEATILHTDHPSFINTINTALRTFSDHASTSSYSHAYSGQGGENLSVHDIAMRINNRKNPELLIGLLPYVAEIIGSPKPSHPIPNLSEWHRGVSIFAIAKSTTLNLKTSYKNRFNKIKKEGEAISSAIKEVINQEMLDTATEYYMRAAAAFTHKSRNILDKYHRENGNEYSRKFIAPHYVSSDGSVELPAGDIFAIAEKAGVISWNEGKTLKSTGAHSSIKEYMPNLPYAEHWTNKTFVEIKFRGFPGLGFWKNKMIGIKTPSKSSRYAVNLIWISHDKGGVLYCTDNGRDDTYMYGKPLKYSNVERPAGLPPRDYRLTEAAHIKEFVLTAMDFYGETTKKKGLEYLRVKIQSTDEYKDLENASSILSFSSALMAYKNGVKLSGETWPTLPEPLDIIDHFSAQLNSYGEDQDLKVERFYSLAAVSDAYKELREKDKEMEPLLSDFLNHEGAYDKVIKQPKYSKLRLALLQLRHPNSSREELDNVLDTIKVTEPISVYTPPLMLDLAALKKRAHELPGSLLFSHSSSSSDDVPLSIMKPNRYELSRLARFSTVLIEHHKENLKLKKQKSNVVRSLINSKNLRIADKLVLEVRIEDQEKTLFEDRILQSCFQNDDYQCFSLYGIARDISDDVTESLDQLLLSREGHISLLDEATSLNQSSAQMYRNIEPN